jgi:TolB-like protein
MVCLAAVAAALALCACALSAFAAQGDGTASAAQGPAYDPAKTKVAIVPFVNSLGREGPEEKRSCEQAGERLRTMFADRSFQVLEDKPVADAVKKLGVDLVDSEDRTKETFKGIGEELGADLVVCGVLLEYRAETKSNVFSSRKYGQAKIELKVYDSHDKAYRVRATQARDTRGSWLLPYLASASDLRWGALQDAIDKALKDFLKPYPITKKSEKGEKSEEAPAPSRG